MTETAVKTEKPVNVVHQIFDDNPPCVQLDSFIEQPNPGSPKTLFSIRIPAKHQAEDLSIVRMQYCDLVPILRKVKMNYRDKSKFVVPTKFGPRVVKLYFFIYPNKADEIQIDYAYNPVASERCATEDDDDDRDYDVDFIHRDEITKQVGSYIHRDVTLQRNINIFASIAHDVICEFIDRVYFESIAKGEKPDYLRMTPPL